MFSFFHKKRTFATPQPQVSAAKTANPLVPARSEFEVHTIPKKFLPVQTSRGYTFRRHMLMGVVVVFLGTLVFGFAAWLLVRTIQKNEREQLVSQQPFIRSTNAPGSPQAPQVPVHPSLLPARDYAECTYTAIEGGKAQRRMIGAFSFEQYAANYFCPQGNLLVQLSAFSSPAELKEFIAWQATAVVDFRDGALAEKNNPAVLLWGSDRFLIRITLQSLERDSLAFALLLDDYRASFTPDTTLPWRKETIPAVLTSQERDEIRVQDVKKIQVALEFYKIDSGTYPPVLDPASLPTLARYLPHIPQGPNASSTASEYLYTVYAGATNYQLMFTLEVGSGAYPAGRYVATPTGIASMEERGGDTPIVPASSDRDRDGMTDVEEVVWGTNAQLADTDSDGYADQQEIVNGFDPLMSAGARLENSLRVKNYVSTLHGFTFFYPSAWDLEEKSEHELQLLVPGRGLLFQVLVDTPSPAVSTTEEWYAREFSVTPGVDTRNRAKIASGQIGLFSPDTLTFYLLHKEKLYLVTYHLGEVSVIDFPATFEAFVRSLRFFENPNP